MKKFESMIMFGALALTCVGLFMSGLSMLDVIPDPWALQLFVGASAFSALIYFGLFLWISFQKDKNNKKSRKQININKMKINKKILKRTSGIAIVAFSSAWLGWSFQFKWESQFLWMILLLIIGASLSSLEK